MSKRLFIHGVQVAGRLVDISIEENRIVALADNLPCPQDAVRIEGGGFAAFPTFANLHTHAAMTLFRGYGNDVPLQQWLNEWIWPKERLLNEERVYWGVRLACVEMIKSGTTAFSDMYFYLPAAARAVRESGIRALLGETVFGDAEAYSNPTSYRVPEWQNDLVRYCVAPHAIYSVSDVGLQRVARYCQSNNLYFHIHMSETEQEVQSCLQKHGCRPYEYLEHLGVLSLMQNRLIGAHSLYLSDSEVELMAQRGVTVVHNPNSNLKLGSGYQFRYSELTRAGVCVALGTDGCASSNNLDMLEAAKTMSLLQKGWRNDPTVLPADETLRVASRNGFLTLDIDAGELTEGKLADLMLVDLNHVAMIPDTHTAANLLYAAHSNIIDTVICDGRIVMRHGKVEGEAEVMEAVRNIVKEMNLASVNN